MIGSANSYELQVGAHTLTAYWAAPFFVLVLPQADDDTPMLIHCDNLEHAISQRRCGILLDATFNKLDWPQVKPVRLGSVDELGYLWCAACKTAEHDVVWSDQSAHIDELCEGCGCTLSASKAQTAQRLAA